MQRSSSPVNSSAKANPLPTLVFTGREQPNHQPPDHNISSIPSQQVTFRAILDIIEAKKAEFAQAPLFQFMQDRRISPSQRLGFAPCIAHFIMSFGDLNKYVFRDESSDDVIQQLVNEHTYEDDHHWQWFLHDLNELGFNRPRCFIDTLRFLWSDETLLSRQLSYQLSACILNADPVIKMAAIEAIEATGNILFSHTAQVAQELEITTGRKYIYFGQFHLNVETGHAAGGEDIEAQLAAVVLSAEMVEQTLQVVTHVFEIFTSWLDEMLTYAQTRLVGDAQTRPVSDWITSVPINPDALGV